MSDRRRGARAAAGRGAGDGEPGGTVPNLPLKQVENVLLYLLARASAEASGPFHAALKERGLAVIEGRILNLLATGTFSVGMLAERALSKQTTVTMALERMARRGLVNPVGDTEDRRRSKVMLTAKGAEIAAQVNRLAFAREERLLAGYSPREAAALKRVLRTLIARAAQGDDEPADS